MKQTLIASALFSTLAVSACTEEEITNFFRGEDNEISVSGKTNNIDDTAEAAVNIEGVYDTPGEPSNPTTTSDANGDFSLQLKENESFYLRASKNGLVSIISSEMNLSSDKADIIFQMPTETEAQDIINTAFSFTPQLFNHAWLLVNVTTSAGDEANSYPVILSAIPAGAVYTSCDGTDSGLIETTGAPCSTDRPAPMYIAYYDTSGNITATVGDESQNISIRIGEIAEIKFVIP
ncbi:MAG: hypothetical protein KJN89_10550 [Gammaproteobacteria bacterium]|nr:hypothetical protein [Gammaproteobacteria bacterium]MBT8134013.1 hypothetical protein [Gammaproteobacteria bacterium]NNJ50806.1 hypothetical protein [Gammaproteobacteria bacterium]